VPVFSAAIIRALQASDVRLQAPTLEP
jgi:hypothetical protein